MIQQCAIVAKKANNPVDCIRRRIGSQSGEVILPVCSELESCAGLHSARQSSVVPSEKMRGSGHSRKQEMAFNTKRLAFFNGD